MTKLLDDATVSGSSLAGPTGKSVLENIYASLQSAGLSESNRSTLTSTASLTVEQAGFRQVDATSGAIAFTLPASGTGSDDIVFEHRRIDNSANTVTYTRAGADTVEGSSTGITLPPYCTIKLMLPAGGTDWRIVSLTPNAAGAQINAFTTGGTGAAYTLTPAPYLPSLVAGRRYRVKWSTVNTGACTLAVSGLTATALRIYDATGGKMALPAGALTTNMLSDVEYDGTHWVVMNRLANTSSIIGISASVAANALTITVNAPLIDFRSSTLGSGTINTRSASAALSLVISSGSTLGTVSGKQSRIAVLLIDNAGTLEVAAVNVAGGQDLSETGLISTTAEGGAGAADSATTIYSTTARSNVAYRVVGFVESTQATAGTWATAPSTIQGAGGNILRALPSMGMVRLRTPNGNGSTNTAIRRFTNTVTNQGSDITYADSATNGATFTINSPGVYAISYTDNFSASNYLGISLNSSQLTTSIPSITEADALAVGHTLSANNPQAVSWSGKLNPGDVIRAHTNVTPGNGTTASVFTIARVG